MDKPNPEKVSSIKIACNKEGCEHTFDSPIWFEYFQSFEKSSLSNNKVACPKCGEHISCDKNNTKVSFENGGFVGTDFRS